MSSYNIDALENLLWEEEETEDGDTCCNEGCVCRQAT